MTFSQVQISVSTTRFFLALLLALLLTPAWARAAGHSSKVNITWSYENFPIPMELYSVRPEKSHYVSETGTVDALKDTPTVRKLNGWLETKWKSSTPAVLVIENKTKADLYFLAVPHELNPHHASAGHYFECLCTGRVYKVPAGKIWYRIVRVNLNESFEGLPKFEINHKIVGLSAKEATTTYASQLYKQE